MKRFKPHTKTEIAILLIIPGMFLFLTLVAAVTGNMENWLNTWRNAGNSILNSVDTLWINIKIEFVKFFSK